ncbi:MAG: PilZ domain-containing protein [Candidatus Sumerlaeia bacterium]|nr:PilZ domain-containing protein [Candidatus Sumerlaeia bacterium]
MSDNIRDIKRAPRYACNYFGYIEVLFPEETFTPKSLYVQVVDISLSGCRLNTKAITKDLYKLMLLEQRHVRMTIDLTDRRVLRLKGRIVWIDYSDAQSAMAISFTGLSDQDEDQLSGLLKELNSSGKILSLEDTRPGVTPKSSRFNG